MKYTASGVLDNHQDVYEWWRNKKGEISDCIEELREAGTVDEEVLSLMEGLLDGAKIRRKFVDYFDEEV
jgi:hypothetical protein